jgi:hypothetical protein
MQAPRKHQHQYDEAATWRPSRRAVHSPLVWFWAACAVALVPAALGIAAEPASAGDRVVEGTANRACEISFTSRKAYADPFNDVRVDAVVTAADGSSQVVPAFWAGGETWRFRYSAQRPGDYRFQTRCSDAANQDLQDASGTIRLGKYDGVNPFYRHGPVRVAPDVPLPQQVWNEGCKITTTPGRSNADYAHGMFSPNARFSACRGRQP